jgi:chemotaxis protein methyltransferase CheR
VRQSVGLSPSKTKRPVYVAPTRIRELRPEVRFDGRKRRKPLTERAQNRQWKSLVPAGARVRIVSDLSHIYFTGVEPSGRESQRRRNALPLASLTQQQPASEQPNRPGHAAVLEPFVASLLTRAGLDARAYQVAPLQRRSAACMRRLRVHSPTAGEALLKQRPHLLAPVLDVLLIGVTEFFRDPPVFEHIRTQVLPELLKARRGISVFSAGVSRGQELYSIAMLLGGLQALPHSRLLGWDCRPHAIARAQAGLYAAEETGNLTKALKRRWFVWDGSRYAAKTELCRQIRWQVADILSALPGGRWEMILFRNTAIYLDASRAALVWERLVGSLAPGGYMITGSAERPPGTLPLRRVRPCVYRKSE